jgi:hypothetical protein
VFPVALLEISETLLVLEEPDPQADKRTIEQTPKKKNARRPGSMSFDRLSKDYKVMPGPAGVKSTASRNAACMQALVHRIEGNCGNRGRGQSQTHRGQAGRRCNHDRAQ